MLKKVITILIIVTLMSIIHLSINTKTIKQSYEIAKLKQKFEKLYSENRYLRSEVAKKESLERIEKIAREKLNMVEPKDIIYIRKGAK